MWKYSPSLASDAGTIHTIVLRETLKIRRFYSRQGCSMHCCLGVLQGVLAYFQLL